MTLAHTNNGIKLTDRVRIKSTGEYGYVDYIYEDGMTCNIALDSGVGHASRIDANELEGMRDSGA